MRAAIRLRSDINANIEVKDTLKHLRLNKINHCVLIPEGKVYDGTAGEVIDRSGNGNHGTSIGADSIAGGKVGRGADFVLCPVDQKQG